MLFDVITLVIGVFFTIRKLDVKRRESVDFPHVVPSAFELWKSTALRSYNIGSFACFGRLALDYGNRFALSRVVPGIVVQVTGGILFFSWVGLLIYAFVLSSRARGLQEKAGIRILPTPPPP